MVTKELKMVSTRERTVTGNDIRDLMEAAQINQVQRKTPPSSDPCGTAPAKPGCDCGSATPAAGVEKLKANALARELQQRAEEGDHESEPDPLRIARCIFAPWTCR